METPEISEEFDLTSIKASLKTKWLGRSLIELWSSIGSTNTRAIELARADGEHGTIIIAREQTAGRGRAGNAWFSPTKSGLYISFLIRPQVSLNTLPVITLIAGVAVAKAVQSSIGIKLGLKWVNDLIADGRKIGGILAEHQKMARASRGVADALIIGIGLNLHKGSMQIQPELEGKIGFLSSLITDKEIAIDKNQLVALLANELEMSIDRLENGELTLLLDEWRAYSITLGEQICASLGEEEIIGEAIDIAENGELIVRTKAGNVRLRAGEVSIRKIDGSYV